MRRLVNNTFRLRILFNIRKKKSLQGNCGDLGTQGYRIIYFKVSGYFSNLKKLNGILRILGYKEYQSFAILEENTM